MDTFLKNENRINAASAERVKAGKSSLDVAVWEIHSWKRFAEDLAVENNLLRADIANLRNLTETK